MTLDKEVTHIYHRAYQMIACTDIYPSSAKIIKSYFSGLEQIFALCIAIYSVPHITFNSLLVVNIEVEIIKISGIWFLCYFP